MASSPQWHWPPKHVSILPKKTSLRWPVFSVSDEKVKTDAFMIYHGNHILILFYLYCCSKHKLSTIVKANVANFSLTLQVKIFVQWNDLVTNSLGLY